MNIVKMKIDDLKAAPYNPRIALEPGMKEYEKLKNSIEEFGFVETPVFNEVTGYIVGGHQRITVAKTLGYKEIEVSIVNIPDPAKEKALNIALNKVDGLWDDDKLAELLKELDQDVSLLTGFNDKEINGLIEAFDYRLDTEIEIQDDDFDVEQALEEINEPVSKLGDIWQLGPHKLMCGDSTNQTEVAKLFGGDKAQMIFTDPPYLMGFEGNVSGDGSKSFNSKYESIKNDKMTRAEGDQFIFNAISTMKAFCDGAYYISFYRLGIDYVFRALDKLDLEYKSLIIWDKGNHTLSGSDYMSKYEPIIYGWFKDHNFYGDRKNFDIWEITRTQKNELHPTMKPLDLMRKAIINSSKQGDVIADFFGGSGSTLISADQLGRNCYMIELDPRYCDVIIKRYESATGIKPVLLIK